jgi:hypothetical protein
MALQALKTHFRAEVNRGEEAELDVDPVAVVVLALI